MDACLWICYKQREKHYFVDAGHERPETIAYKPVFTQITGDTKSEPIIGSKSHMKSLKLWSLREALQQTVILTFIQLMVQKWWSITWTPLMPLMRDWVHCLLERASAYKSQSIPDQLYLWDKMEQSSNCFYF